MSGDDHRTQRITTVVAATCISLACGANYAYSAWGPQFAARLQLSATQSNIIGTMGNVGQYASGIPVGLLVDNKGPRPSLLLGGICLGLGYFPISRAYESGPGSVSVAFVAMLSFLTGVGSCAAFSAAIKASALNWPEHRGTATGLPLAAFGLSALFFTVTASVFFPSNTSALLLFLSIGTTVIVLGGIPFVRLPSSSPYSALVHHTMTPGSRRRDSNQMHHTKPEMYRVHDENGKLPGPAAATSSEASSVAPAQINGDDGYDPDGSDSDDLSSLLSAPGDIGAEDVGRKHDYHDSHHLDVSGLQILRHFEFYQLFTLLGLLTGVGLMTINNIGNDIQALWLHWDPNVHKDFVAHRQLIHVSIISLFSFIGRLFSGIGSDYLVKQMQMSRFWCVTASATVFILAQIAGLSIRNPNLLWILSSLNGLAYGALFGVYPSLTADAFGVNGLSLNWGCLILSPVIFSNIFNIAYGRITDSHSTRSEGGAHVCKEGLGCYQDAYWLSLTGAFIGVLFSLWCIWHEKQAKLRRKLEEAESNDHRA